MLWLMSSTRRSPPSAQASTPCSRNRRGAISRNGAGIDAMLAESPGRDQQEWLEIMDEESGRLSAMMTEAIQMARIEAGHVDLDKQMHTVEDLIYSALEKEMAEGS